MTRFEFRSWLGFWGRPFLSRERVQAYQDARIRRLARHAWENVPFYRRRFEASGVRPEEIRGGVDLARLPLLSKADLFDTPIEDFVARGTDAASCLVEISSGTTGEPVRFLRTRAEEYTLFAHRLRAQVLSGLRPWNIRMKIGSPPVKTWPHRLGLFRCDNVSDRLPHAEILTQLEKKKFDVLYATPGMLDVLSPLLAESRLRAGRLRLVFSGAELLPRYKRIRLSETLGCPVVDFYGATEVNLIAWECVRCGVYHTCDDGVLAEVLNDDGSAAQVGEYGRLVVTALHSFAMPLIRYDLGDVVRRPARTPACPIGFGSIDQIAGRLADYLVLPNGQWLSPYRLIEVAQAVEGIRRFQILQAGPADLVVQVQPAAGFGDESVRRLRLGFTELLPDDVRVGIRRVEEIPLTPACKLRIVQAWSGKGAGGVAVPPSDEG